MRALTPRAAFKLTADDIAAEKLAEQAGDALPNSYTLEVAPNLVGSLMLRYWVEGDPRPSPYSKRVTLPKFKGGVDGMGGGKGSKGADGLHEKHNMAIYHTIPYHTIPYHTIPHTTSMTCQVRMQRRR